MKHLPGIFLIVLTSIGCTSLKHDAQEEVHSKIIKNERLGSYAIGHCLLKCRVRDKTTAETLYFSRIVLTNTETKAEYAGFVDVDELYSVKCRYPIS